MGIAKVLFDLDEKASETGNGAVLDHDFIREHTTALMSPGPRRRPLIGRKSKSVLG
jgi:hypothetical protein